MQERALGMKNSQPLSRCSALCSIGTQIAVLHTVVVQWIWYFQTTIKSRDDPKGSVDTQVPHSFCPALVLESGKAIMVFTLNLRLSETKNSQLRWPISDLHF